MFFITLSKRLLILCVQAAGECYRLYTEPAYEVRPQVAEAEILRTDLSSAILTLIAMNQNPFDFPYIDQPSRPFSAYPHFLSARPSTEIGFSRRTSGSGTVTTRGYHSQALPPDGTRQTDAALPHDSITIANPPRILQGRMPIRDY